MEACFLTAGGVILMDYPKCFLSRTLIIVGSLHNYLMLWLSNTLIQICLVLVMQTARYKQKKGQENFYTCQHTSANKFRKFGVGNLNEKST